MDGSKTTLERAFELAKSGQYGNIADIRRKLIAEGYSTEQITGLTLMRQLRAAIRQFRDRTAL